MENQNFLEIPLQNISPPSFCSIIFNLNSSHFIKSIVKLIIINSFE